ncbi:DUF421 domain-containing protein [Paenibacillus albiflavus]|uniref:DUF421 domain-containing protein n=1 Tax=Paenibacillus albiflavus TaxID=2545760 RepID=A0A4R4EM50_9BACL|nr:DUF421 domain-containing protein [Paenibacillus albiflavus]TCZ81129.1 DUF421 domain-containing protein [Paenibacillus albiflavus]
MYEALTIVWRTVIAILSIFVVTKLLGKRQVSQLSLFEYITGISIGALTAYISLNLNAKWYLGIIAILVWVVLSLGIEYLQLKSKRARTFIDGKATVLVKDGKILEDNLKTERLSTDELMESLRKNKAFKLADVEFAIMEPSGDINVLLKKETMPLTPKHLGIKVAPEQEPQCVIMDGQILDESLRTVGLTREWLNTELNKQGLLLNNVLLAQVDAYNQLYIDTYDDKISVPLPQSKAQLYAELKKCEADLEMYSLTSSNQSAKQMYEEVSIQLNQIIQDLKPILTR